VAFSEYMSFKDNGSKESDELIEQNQDTEAAAVIEITEVAEVAEVAEVTEVTEAAIVTKVNQFNESAAVIEGTKVIDAARVTLSLAKALTEPVKDNKSSDVTEATGPIDEIVLTNGVAENLITISVLEETEMIDGTSVTDMLTEIKADLNVNDDENNSKAIEVLKELNMIDTELQFLNELIKSANVNRFGVTESLRYIIEGHSGGKWYVGIAEEDYCLTKSWLLAYKSYHVKYLGYVWKFDMIRLTV